MQLSLQCCSQLEQLHMSTICFEPLRTPHRKTYKAKFRSYFQSIDKLPAMSNTQILLEKRLCYFINFNPFY